MPSPSSRTVKERGRNGKLVEKSKSFHGRIPSGGGPSPATLRRPRTQPDLISSVRSLDPSAVRGGEAYVPSKLTKLLLNVTVQRSLGAVQVVISPESTVGDLVREVVRAYGREGRRPLLPTTDPDGFALHYSQFSLQSLDPTERLITLGSRNFFLCPKPTPPPTTCSNQAEKASKTGLPWLRFLDLWQ